MKKFLRQFVVLIILALFAISVQAQSPTATLALQDTTINANSVSEIVVALDCPQQACVSVKTEVSFDPTLLRVETVDLGPYWGGNGHFIEAETSVDNVAGTVKLSAAMDLSAVITTPEPTPEATVEPASTEIPASPVNADMADNAAFIITITSLARGTGQLHLVSATVSDANGTSIDTTLTDGSLTIINPPLVRLRQSEPAYSGPGTQYDVVGQTPIGVELPVVGVSGDGAWYFVILTDGTYGWVAAGQFLSFSGDISYVPVMAADEANQLSLTESVNSPTGVIVTNKTRFGINIRAGDSVLFHIVGVMRPGQSLPVLGRSERNPRWLYVAFGYKRRGWILSTVVTVTGDTSSLPGLKPPPLTQTNTPLPPPLVPPTGTSSLPQAVSLY